MHLEDTANDRSDASFVSTFPSVFAFPVQPHGLIGNIVSGRYRIYLMGMIKLVTKLVVRMCLEQILSVMK